MGIMTTVPSLLLSLTKRINLIALLKNQSLSDKHVLLFKFQTVASNQPPQWYRQDC
jgi:hypothetical protein